MHQPVTVQVAGGIGVLTVDNPPNNALDANVLSHLDRALDAMAEKSDLKALIIAARGRSFASTSDPILAGGKADVLTLAKVCAKLEDFARPVVAAMQGDVDGQGLELALAAHYRLADRRARLSLDGVRIGLPPGAGGSQRLPRLIGVHQAIDMLMAGSQVAAKDAVEIGLIDGVAAGPLPVFSMNWVKAALAEGLGPRRTRATREQLEPAKTNLAQVQRAREGLPASALTVHRAILDAIEAAIILPFDVATTKELAIYEDCAKSAESLALRHVLTAEVRASQAPTETAVTPAKITKVGVVGGGRIGRSVAVAGLRAGYEVTLVETDIDRLEEAVEGIIDLIDQEISQKRLSSDDRDSMLGRLAGKVDIAAVTGVDLVIAATAEDAETKRRVFAALDAVMQRGAVLATTSSRADLDGLAAGTGRADAVVGLHFFPPAHRLRTIEVVLGVGTSDKTMATAFEFAKRLGKVPVATVVSDGFIAYRMFSAMLDAALFAYVQGTPIEDVDRAIEAYGFPLGPFRLADALGIDEAERLQPAHSSALGLRAREVLSRLVADKRLGRQRARGFYIHQRGGAPSRSDPELADLMQGLVSNAKPMAPGHIRRACLSALVNQGAAILEEGIAQRPSDIDVLMLQVFGYPRFKGGPMMDADLTGLLRVRRDLGRLSRDFPELWTPQPMFDELIKNGEAFASLND
jgi:3-hydroxyacyl-CoA dehydrogenase